MSTSLENFVRNPLKDFIRKRKLHFEDIINLLLSINGNSLSKELLDYFQYDSNTASTSAFVLVHQLCTAVAPLFFFLVLLSSHHWRTINNLQDCLFDSPLNIIPVSLYQNCRLLGWLQVTPIP